MIFPATSTTASNRYYSYVNQRKGIVSREESIETEKRVTRAKIKRTVSECAIVACGVDLIYFGFKRAFKKQNMIEEGQWKEHVQRMNVPKIASFLKKAKK